VKAGIDLAIVSYSVVTTPGDLILIVKQIRYLRGKAAKKLIDDTWQLVSPQDRLQFPSSAPVQLLTFRPSKEPQDVRRSPEDQDREE
jgi:hypothetical protein